MFAFPFLSSHVVLEGSAPKGFGSLQKANGKGKQADLLYCWNDIIQDARDPRGSGIESEARESADITLYIFRRCYSTSTSKTTWNKPSEKVVSSFMVLVQAPSSSLVFRSWGTTYGFSSSGHKRAGAKTAIDAIQARPGSLLPQRTNLPYPHSMDITAHPPQSDYPSRKPTR